MSTNFNQIKFLGATVTDFKATVGWNEQSTQITVDVVEDKNMGDDFALKVGNAQNYQGKMMGTPTNFQAGNFIFNGLIRGWKQQNSFQGNPTYQVTLISPIEILDATQVILSTYVGPINDSLPLGGGTSSSGGFFQCTTLLNVYGYLEGGGNNFGNSLENEGGLLWLSDQGVKSSLETLTNINPSTQLDQTQNFGHYITYKGNYYRLDLSGLPIPQSYYRIGGQTSTSLLQLITDFCEDGGVDYMPILTLGQGIGPHTISFTTVNLQNPPTFNQLSQYITSQTDLNNYTTGQESRTDITQTFLIGGDLSLLMPVQNSLSSIYIVPFWGFDVNGNPITGYKPDGSQYADDNHAMQLNATPIADIMGSLGLGLSYASTILEMRCALINYDSWATYLTIYNKTFAQALGIVSSMKFDNDGYVQTLVSDFIEDGIDAAQQLGTMNENDQWTTVSQRVYEFVKSQAETYYGKQFMVLIPLNVQVKIVPDSVATLYNYEPSDAGYLPEGINPLGLNYINENFFMDQTGRFNPFLQFSYNAQFQSVGTLADFANNVSNINYKYVSANPSILDTSAKIQPAQDPSFTSVYLKNYSVEQGPVLQDGLLSGGDSIFFLTSIYGGPSTPCMVISIASPVFAQAEDPLGGVKDLATMLNVSIENLMSAVNFRSDSFQFRLHPPAIYPNGVAIAMKSNQLTYGPWGNSRADGKTNFEQDTTLVPWEYGGYNTMNLAALAKIANTCTNKRVQDIGSFEEADLPKVSLGQALVNGGPEVTSIDCSISTQGVTTTYMMESFIPRAAKFNRDNADRLKRFGKAYQQMRRDIRKLYIEKGNVQSTINSYYGGFMNGTSYAVKQQSAHAVIGAHLIYNSDSNSYNPVAYAQTYKESVANCRGNNDEEYLIGATMGMEGLFRPFCTNPNGSGVSTYQIPSGTNGLTNVQLNPLQPNNDFLWFSSGDTYPGLNNKKNNFDTTNARLVGLRGPMVMVGWGYDLYGNPVPNATASGTDPLQNYSNQFSSNHLQNSINWPAGAIDLRWDKLRAVWASPGMILTGKMTTSLSPGGSGQMQLYLGNGTALNEFVSVNHFFSSNTLSPGTKVIAGFSPLDNLVYALASDCTN